MAVHVPVLWPVCAHTIPISNVVVSVTIHDDTGVYVYVYKRDVAKNMKPLWKVAQIVCETWVLVAKDKSNHPAANSLRSVPQESWSWATLSGKANDWRIREHVCVCAVLRKSK